MNIGLHKLVCSELIKDFIELINQGYTISKENELMLKQFNAKQQDLLHDIEIPDKMTKTDIATIGTAIRNLRKERRDVKDELLIAEHFFKFKNDHPEVIDALTTLMNDIKKSEDFLSNRHYVIKSSLVTAKSGETYADNLANDDNKILLLINKILKKWSELYETTVESGTDTNRTINFWLKNLNYDYSAAKSSLSNFNLVFRKDLNSLYGDTAEIKDFVISQYPIVKLDTTGELKAVMTIRIGKITYTINGKIIYRDIVQSKRNTSKVKKSTKKKRR